MLRLIVECDGCGKMVTAEDDGPVARSARSVAERAGWLQGRGEDHCPECVLNAHFGRSVLNGR